MKAGRVMVWSIIRKDIVIGTRDIGDWTFFQGHVWCAAPIVNAIRFRGAKVLKTVVETVLVDLRRA